jgi:O-antigen ligase
VGFFANRNHYAAFLYVLLLVAAAWAVHAAMGVGTLRVSEFQAGPLVAVIAGFTLLVVLLACEAMARSRAGLTLTIVALFGAFALGFTDRRIASGFIPNRVLLAAVSLAVIFAIQYALYRILERFDVELALDARLDFGKHTIEAAKAYMPIGSGLGSFVQVYALFETPEGTWANTFANHAHNDILEFWLEAGILGLAFMAYFAIWFVFRAVHIWQSIPPRAGALDWSLTRAATLIVALVVAHSFVDYPLRTGAMTAILAFACGLMINPLVTVEEPPAPRVEQGRQRRKMTEPTTRAAIPAMSLRASPIAKWDSHIKWPDEWTKGSGSSTKMSSGSSDPSDNTS